jgi:hypothetical protein
MKIISIFFSIVLVFPIVYFLLHILQLYDSRGPLKAFGVDDKFIFQLARNSFIFLIVYVTAFLIAIYFNIKKKYVTNSIFLTVMIVIYIIITLFRLS